MNYPGSPQFIINEMSASFPFYYFHCFCMKLIKQSAMASNTKKLVSEFELL